MTAYLAKVKADEPVVIQSEPGNFENIESLLSHINNNLKNWLKLV